MPAVRAASALAPTARMEKPNVVRLSSHQTPYAATNASSTPKWRPKTCGKAALLSTRGLIRFATFFCSKGLRLSSQLSRSIAV